MHTNVKRRMLIKKFVRLKYLFVVLGCVGAISTWPVRGQVLPSASPALAPTAISPPNTDTGLQALAQTLALDQITTLPQHEFRYELKYPRQDECNQQRGPARTRNGGSEPLSNSNVNGFNNNPGSLPNGPFINNSSTNLNGNSFGTSNGHHKRLNNEEDRKCRERT